MTLGISICIDTDRMYTPASPYLIPTYTKECERLWEANLHVGLQCWKCASLERALDALELIVDFAETKASAPSKSNELGSM